MRVLSWNCRGLGSPSAVLQCPKKAQEYKPKIMFLMETKLNKNKGRGILERCSFLDGWEVPKEGFSGGLFLGWMPNLKVNIQHGSKNLIYVDLADTSGNPLSISFIYGHPNLAKREEVWVELKSVRSISHRNWLCIGDFNQLLSREDKFGFKNSRIEGAEAFRQTLFKLELCELEATGQKYTWMNEYEDDSFIMERLDRAFASVEWINSHPHYALRNQPILRSDHGSIVLDFELRQPSRKRPFKLQGLSRSTQV